MRPLKDAAIWPKIAVYDIETTEWTNVVLVCHVDEYGNRVHFPTVRQYVDWLFTNFEGRHVWAHAGGRFDHRFLIPELDRRGWDFRAALSGGSIVLMTAQYKGKKMHFADSYRLMPDSLKKIGKTVGLEKIDVDRGHMESLTKAEQIEYCFRDCDIALKGLQLMRDTLTGVNADFAYTLASIATRWVRRSPVIDFMRFYQPKDGTLVYNPKNMEVDKWCEPAYFGGRCEIFKRGKFQGPIYYYDIVSSYPASMREELPLYFTGYFPPPESSSKAALRRYLSYTGITEALVSMPETQVGVLCVKYQGRLTFPWGPSLGRFEKVKRGGKEETIGVPGRWTNIELLAALDRGATITPLGQARFESKAFTRPFVDTFYGLRKRAREDKDAFRTYAYKILLNSLYGKFAETLDRNAYVTSAREIEYARKKGSQVLSTKVPGVYQIVSQEEGPFRHIAAGAYVTALSRLRLLEGLELALSKGGEIYYCDTDSIMTNVPLPELEGSELGQWKHEYTFTDLEILLPKVYRATTDTGEVLYRCKGIPVVRENDAPDDPEKRWLAYKLYEKTGDPEMARLLTKDGLSGFVADINAGTLKPRRMPLLRCMQGQDRKRAWTGDESMALRLEVVK